MSRIEEEMYQLNSDGYDEAYQAMNGNKGTASRVEDAGVTPLQFMELDKWIGEPLWDCNINRWRVLVGYRRYDGTREVIFTDSKGMECWEGVKLTIQKVANPKLDVDAIRAGMVKKDFREHCFG